MITIRELQELLTNNKSFNPYIDISNPDKVLLHLIEEIGELCKAYRKNGSDSIEFNSELGDVQILLLFFSTATHTDLQNVTLLKIGDNIKKGKFQPTEKELKKLPVIEGLGDIFG